MRRTLTLLAFAVGFAAAHPAFSAEADREVSLYKSPQCGCCETYANHLRDNGFTVTVRPTGDLVQMNQAAGIPDDFQSCHLAFVDGYAVSGHVPVKAVERMLTERPDIQGITLPGMPAGSPGMGGAKSAPFKIYGFGKDVPKVYAVE